MSKSTEKKQSVKHSDKAKKAPAKQHKVAKYFKDLKSEFKKVVWPSKKTVVHNTGIVLAMMAVSGVFIWALDLGFSQLLNLIVGGK